MNSYDDIINLPHPISAKHPQMSVENRAAQFSPFAALTGFDAAIKETARLTDRRIELTENDIADLDSKLNLLKEYISDQPDITVTYFKPDEKKDGGAYITITDLLKKIDDFERIIFLMSGAKILIEDVFDIECELFKDLE